MHVVVCVKQIPNPEIAAAVFRVDEQANKVVPVPGQAPVMSPFDEQAIDAALRLRDAGTEARITLLTLGAESARQALKHGLAMGADDAVLLSDPALDEPDAYATALALSAAIRKLGAVDLVLTGRQAADWDAGIVGAGLGELLDLPVLSFARDIRLEQGALRVERVLDDGFEVLETALPAVVTVSNEIGPARTPNLRETMRAARKPVQSWKAADLGLNERGESVGRRLLEALRIPVKDGRCEWIEGETVQAQAECLAARLVEAKLI